jgi:hypothetical protein
VEDWSHPPRYDDGYTPPADQPYWFPERETMDPAERDDLAHRAAGLDRWQHRWDAKLQMEGSLASGEHLSTISRGPVTITGVGLGEAFPMGASRREIQHGDLVNIDLGRNRAGYHGDMAAPMRSAS